ncbi:hypothetical protein [Hymenobacter psychrophilus]|uniref:Uncharacterized protein n=1 Tax=Hymenobacter psychrophilus TaxID=651662 RepID=A0A1H3BRF7_9BACT|nr:hypothetical protein [Hymenobacter psychrophilus]SDX44562.1 hypothetical protein SAMN04488069_101394 [Hymenobacter psychrophilus]
MPPVPFGLDLAFILTTILTLGMLLRVVAAQYRQALLVAGGPWLLNQAVMAYTGFYTITDTLPPRFALAIGPPLLALLALLATARGRRFLDELPPDRLTLLHVVRIPVELVLWALYYYQAVPGLMTFEGRNWDILMGLTAPLVYYLAFRRRWLGPGGLVVWNVVGLLLLGNIVRLGLLSAPGPFQQFSFEQPNMALMYFPYVWLPAFVVPVVLLAHVAALWQLRAAHKVGAVSGRETDQTLDN